MGWLLPFWRSSLFFTVAGCCHTCLPSGLALILLRVVLLVLNLYSGFEMARLWEELQVDWTLSLVLLDTVVVVPWWLLFCRVLSSRNNFICVSSISRMVSFCWIILSFCLLISSYLLIISLFCFSITVRRDTQSESGPWHFLLVDELSLLPSLSLFFVRNRLLPNLLWVLFNSIFWCKSGELRTFLWIQSVCFWAYFDKTANCISADKRYPVQIRKLTETSMPSCAEFIH